MDFKIFEVLKESFGVSSQNNNQFEQALNNVKWDSALFCEEDGEWIFEITFLNGSWMIFSTESKNPFKCTRKPAAIFSDGSYIEV